MPDVTEQCRHCLAYGEQRRLLVRDTSAAELPAVQCGYCEAVCLVTPLATSTERVLALEAKCDLLAASLRQADGRNAALIDQLSRAEADRARLRAENEKLTAAMQQNERLDP